MSGKPASTLTANCKKIPPLISDSRPEYGKTRKARKQVFYRRSFQRITLLAAGKPARQGNKDFDEGAYDGWQTRVRENPQGKESSFSAKKLSADNAARACKKPQDEEVRFLTRELTTGGRPECGKTRKARRLVF